MDNNNEQAKLEELTSAELLEELETLEFPQEDVVGSEEAAEEAAEAPEAEDPDAWKVCGEEVPCEDCERREACDLLKEHEAAHEAQQSVKKKSWKVGVAVAAAIAVLAVAALFIAKAVKGNAPQTQEPAQAPSVEAPAETPEQEPVKEQLDMNAGQPELSGYPSYTVSSEELTEEVLNRVVATCGEDTLDNRTLGVYYWQEYYSFLNSAGQYAAYLIDSTKDLDQQLYFGDQSITWEQQLLGAALDTYGTVSALCQQAEAQGFALSEVDEAYLKNSQESLDQAAAYYGFESGEAYLQQAYGPSVDLDTYWAFARTTVTASAYLEQLVESREITDEEVEAYYDENADYFAQSRVLKVDKPNVNIRHILIQPLETDETTGEYTEAAWAEAEAAIQEVFDTYMAGEQTEDAFAALAIEHSVDGSAAAGGMITDVYPGQMVDSFNDWCFADGRQVGDCEIVKSEFGYHIIYFSSVGETIYWRTVAEGECKNSIAMDIQQQVRTAIPMEADLEQVALEDVLALQRAAQAQQAQQTEQTPEG